MVRRFFRKKEIPVQFWIGARMKLLWNTIKAVFKRKPLPVCSNCGHNHPGYDPWWSDGCGCHIEGCNCTWTW